jgi:rfaE bifunctional protein nucleotidyltransferase chain/domain
MVGRSGCAGERSIYIRDCAVSAGAVSSVADQLPNPKLFSLPVAVGRRLQLQEQGKRLAITNGVFDLLHTGHLYYLQKARELADALFVVLNSDASVKQLKGPLRPVQSEAERAYALAALQCVDGVIIFREKRLTQEIRALRPDVYVKAGDYTLEKLDPGERGTLQEVGAHIEFMPFLQGFSTTSLIAKIKAAGEI